MEEVNVDTLTLTAGEYLVGDPCYLFGHDSIDTQRWMDLLHSCDYFRRPFGRVDDVWIIAFSTAYGDGCYPDENGRAYAVDAGLIGITPAKFFPVDNNFQLLMHRIVFDKPFSVFEDNGTICFGDVHIHTEDGYSEDDEYEGW